MLAEAPSESSNVIQHLKTNDGESHPIPPAQNEHVVTYPSLCDIKRIKKVMYLAFAKQCVCFKSKSLVILIRQGIFLKSIMHVPR
jgi:hypothetical protein